MTADGMEAVKAAHPELDDDSAARIAEAYSVIASDSGGTVEDMAAESRRAEDSSSVGNQSTP